MAHIALVTGGSRGIGAAIARQLADDGYRVVTLARSQPVDVLCDVTDRKSVHAALERIQAQVGSPDILVNNAGFGGPFHRIDEIDDAEWETIFATNIRAPFWFCRALLPQMKARGFGRVINIGSIQSLRAAPLSSTYIATKHALIGFTKAVASEWGRWGITCNAICPGYVTTGPKANIPAGRFAHPGEVAHAVSFLAGPNSAYTNGAVLTIDGGLIAGYGLAAEDIL